MYTFLFMANLHVPELEHRLSDSLEINRKLIPAGTTPLKTDTVILSDHKMGWFSIVPENAGRRSLISVYQDHMLLTLVYGNIYDPREHLSSASILAEAWQKGGVFSARRLDGCFSAIVSELNKNTSYILSSFVGNRTLHYYITDDDVVLISGQDIPIVATGLCPVEFDLVSVSSILACDWSLRGKSLLQHINTCSPFEYLRLKDGKLEVIKDPMLSLDDRISCSDYISRRQLHTEMVSTMKTRVKAIAASEEQIDMALTAGIDSRAILASLLMGFLPEQINAFTDGSSLCVDVATARKVAMIYGVPHSSACPAAPDLNQFLLNCTTMAYFMNGACNSGRAITQPGIYDSEKNIFFGGNGGEIFRGYYYPLNQVVENQLNDERALKVLQKKIFHAQSLEFADNSILKSVSHRLTQSIEVLSGFSKNGYDILDLFYLFERYGIWSNTVYLPHSDSYHFLFDNFRLISLAYRFPVPIGLHCTFHLEMVRKLLPRAYWIPVNSKYLLPFAHIPTMRRIFSFWNKLLKLCSFIKRNRKVVAAQRDATKSFRQVQAEIFAGPLSTLCYDMLADNKSLSCELLGKKGITNLLEKHRTGEQNNLLAIGHLLTIERFKAITMEATAMAGCKEGAF